MLNKINRNVINRTSWRAPALAALSVGLAAAHASPAPNTAHHPSGGARAASRPAASTPVILKLAPGGLTPARQAALARLGAGVTRHLGFIGSVAVTVPSRNLARVAALPFVTHVSCDGQVHKCDEFTVAASGAGAAYQQYGLTGQGVTVAVVDSGVQCNHWDLLDANGDGNSRVIGYADFVPSTNGPKLYSDYCGHGSHVAGIIAGNGAASTGSQCTHTYYGIARNASLVNVRVLDQNGAGSVSTVLAGIQWVVAHKNDNRRAPIRVLNLSLGHPVGESYTTDPLCQAVEAAWKAGIVVVCAAGNAGRVSNTVAAGQSNEGYGTAYGSIQSPGNDPYVITVGATKSVDGSRWHDRVATYSSRGPSRLDLVLKPDIIAPGNQVISLDVDWATLNAAYGGTNMLPYSAYTTAAASGAAGTLGAANRAGAGMSDAYFRLSGTSMAAPVVAGAAALLLQANPRLSPDTVKARLMVSADKWGAPDWRGNPTGQADPCTYGAGYLNIPAAIQSSVFAGQSALSPTLTEDGSGNVAINASGIMSASHVIWGSTGVNDLHVIWGTNAISGSSALSASHVIWGSSVFSDHVIWGTSTSAVDLSSVAINGE